MAARMSSLAASTAMVRPLLRTLLTIQGMFFSILSTRSDGTEMLTLREANRSLIRLANSAICG